jgi:hypothetical protein
MEEDGGGGGWGYIQFFRIFFIVEVSGNAKPINLAQFHLKHLALSCYAGKAGIFRCPA